MWLIATDEAGYGPKLGPLVVTATTWWIDDEAAVSLPEVFAAFAKPIECNGVTVRVDDSKAIFRPASASVRDQNEALFSDVPCGLRSLHLAVSAASAMAGLTECRFSSWLLRTANRSPTDMAAVPWFESLEGCDLAGHEACRNVVDAWQVSPARLHAIHSSVINARQFNKFCSSGQNKADLLSSSTLDLVRQAMQGCGADGGSVERPVQVYCDRHGGRRYYAGVLQHIWAVNSNAGSASECDSVLVQVVDEARHESRYRLSGSTLNADVRFTVKGDRFTPVAMSSLIAKYTRERLMGCFNAYFGKHHRGASPLKPTAGYPVDADRFLADVRSVIERQQIAVSDLVRCR